MSYKGQGINTVFKVLPKRYVDIGDVHEIGDYIAVCAQLPDTDGPPAWLIERSREGLLQRIEKARQRREYHPKTCDVMFLAVQGFL